MFKVLKFSGEWCSPCKILEKPFNSLKTEFTQVMFLDIDVDFQRELANKYDVISVPTVILEKNGQVVSKIVGAKSIQIYSNEIKKHLN